MQFLILILLLAFLIFLFCLYLLAKEELVFVRKNITLEALFNLAFLTGFVGLFSARLLFVILNPSRDYLNPLVFLLFPYFPGLSLVGGIVGGMSFLFYYGKLKKWPTGRIFDYFSLALLASLPFGYLGTQVINQMGDLFVLIMMPLIYGATLIFFVKILVPLNVRGEIKDGSLGFLFLMVFSFISLLANIVRSDDTLSFLLKIDTILMLLLFFSALALLFVQERGAKRNKKIDRKVSE